MDFLLLLLATLTCTAKFIMCKKIGHDTSDTKRMFLYNGVIFCIGSSVILISLANKLSEIIEISSFSFLLAVLFAFFILFTQSTEILAMNFGSVSMTLIIFSCGFLIPIFYGVAAYKETISPWQIIGLVILIVALFLIISPQKSEKLSFAWLILSVLSMLGSGTNAVIQKIHQKSLYKDELLPFLFWALIFSAIFSFLAFFLTRGTSSVKKAKRKCAR